MSYRIDHLFSPVLDGSGNPLSGAKLYVDQAGTSTTVTTYSDDALSSSNASPVVADAEGRFPAIFLPGGKYRVRITTSADVSVSDRDNLTLAGRLIDFLVIAGTDDTQYEELSVGGDIALIGTAGRFFSNLYDNGAVVFVDDGYGGVLSIQDGAGDVAIQVSSTQNASGAAASATMRTVAQYDRSGQRWLLNDHTGDGIAVLDSNIVSFPGAYNATTASAANVVVSGVSGTLRRSTSSEQYKRQIEAMELDRAYEIVTKSLAIWYRSKCEADNPDFSYWGFSAEQILRDVDPRLVHLGKKGQPEGAQYERWVPALVTVLQDIIPRLEKVESGTRNEQVQSAASGVERRLATLEAEMKAIQSMGKSNE